MSDQIQLRVITPARVVLDEGVSEVTAPGTVGQFGVLPNHITFLSTLEIGLLEYRTGRERRALAVKAGFAEVVGDVMTVLTAAAESPAEVDMARAERELSAANSQLAELSPFADTYALVGAERQWAAARLSLAPKKK